MRSTSDKIVRIEGLKPRVLEAMRLHAKLQPDSGRTAFSMGSKGDATQFDMRGELLIMSLFHTAS